MTEEQILWLERLRTDDLPRVGGKLARLGQLGADGHSIPRGFAVPADVLTAAIPEDVRADVSSRIHSTAPAELGQVAGQVRALVEQAALAPELAAAIRDAYAQLGDEIQVAVRSSGVKEDGETASFAGQFDTYLGIIGADAVVHRVQCCWASQFTPRALEYGRRSGLTEGVGAMAVGVVEMVAARSSGVVMTVNPVDGDRALAVVEGSWGLGEAVVSGAVTPDRWLVKKAGGEIVEENPARKEVWSVFDESAGHVIERPMPAELRDSPSLTHDQVRAVVGEALAIEDREGCPQDVEWALTEDDRVVLLQHRPETTCTTSEAGEPFDPVDYALRNVLGVGRQR